VAALLLLAFIRKDVWLYSYIRSCKKPFVLRHPGIKYTFGSACRVVPVVAGDVRRNLLLYPITPLIAPLIAFYPIASLIAPP
jgi:hypothetical protein